MVDIDIHVKPVDEGASSFLDKLAAKAKQFRREDALSGEKALGGALRDGVGGLADLGMSALGIAVPAMIAQAVARSVSNMAKSYEAIQTGAKSAWDLVLDAPVVGEVTTAMLDVREALNGSAIEVRKMKEASTKATLGMNEFVKMHEQQRKEGQGLDVGMATNAQIGAAPFTQKLLTLGDERAAARLHYDELGNTISISSMDPAQKATAQKENARLRLEALAVIDDKEKRYREEHRKDLLQEGLAQANTEMAQAQDIATQHERQRGEINKAEISALEADGDKKRQALAKEKAASEKAYGYAFEDDFKKRGVLLEDQIQAGIDLAKKRQAETSADLKSQVLQKRLGGTAGELEAIRASYTDRIKNAGSPEDRSNLLAMMGMDLLDAGKGGVTFNNRTAGGTGMAERYGGGVSEALTTRTALVDTSKSAKVSVERLTRIVELLEKNEDKTGAELRVIVVGALGNNN